MGRRLVLHALLRLLGHHVDRQLGQVTDHRFDIAADIADLGELRGLDLEKGALGQMRQPAGDLGFAHAGRPDHDDIFRGDLLAQRWFDLLPPPAVAQGNGHRAFGIGLTDDVPIQFGNGFLGGE